MNLEDLRKQIDAIDLEMEELFLKRMALSKQVGAYKKENNLPILNLKRENEIIENKKKNFLEKDLWIYYESFIKHIMDLSKEVQK